MVPGGKVLRKLPCNPQNAGPVNGSHRLLTAPHSVTPAPSPQGWQEIRTLWLRLFRASVCPFGSLTRLADAHFVLGPEDGERNQTVPALEKRLVCGSGACVSRHFAEQVSHHTAKSQRASSEGRRNRCILRMARRQVRGTWR